MTQGFYEAGRWEAKQTEAVSVPTGMDAAAVSPYWPPRPARPPLRSAQPALVMSAVSCLGATLASVFGVVMFIGLITGRWGEDRWRQSSEADGLLLVMALPALVGVVVLVAVVAVCLVLYRVVAVGMAREKQWARVLGFVLAGLGLFGVVTSAPLLEMPAMVFAFAMVPDPLYLFSAVVVMIGGVLGLGYVATTIWWIIAAARATVGGRPAIPAWPVPAGPSFAGAPVSAVSGGDVSAAPYDGEHIT